VPEVDSMGTNTTQQALDLDFGVKHFLNSLNCINCPSLHRFVTKIIFIKEFIASAILC
jgi:hypothetical protein